MNRFLRLVAGKPNTDETSFATAFYSDLTVDVLARTIWGEARGEGLDGMEAVANVVINRVAVAEARDGHYWWGSNVISVCHKPYQFSCWNRSDANYRKLLAVTEADIHFATALRIARRALAGILPDRTSGATHYHAKTVSPSWARGVTPSAVIKNHVFYHILEV